MTTYRPSVSRALSPFQTFRAGHGMSGHATPMCLRSRDSAKGSRTVVTAASASALRQNAISSGPKATPCMRSHGKHEPLLRLSRGTPFVVIAPCMKCSMSIMSGARHTPATMFGPPQAIATSNSLTHNAESQSNSSLADFAMNDLIRGNRPAGNQFSTRAGCIRPSTLNGRCCSKDLKTTGDGLKLCATMCRTPSAMKSCPRLPPRCSSRSTLTAGGRRLKVRVTDSVQEALRVAGFLCSFDRAGRFARGRPRRPSHPCQRGNRNRGDHEDSEPRSERQR